MSLFDWGIFKPCGELILIMSSVFYLACVVGALYLLWQVGKMLHSANIALLLGVILVSPMAYMAWQSTELQHTSAHYQESTHIAAVITVGVCYNTTFLVWIVLRWLDFRRENMN